MSPPRHSVWELVKEEIDGGNLAVPDDYEIGSGVSWRLARASLAQTAKPSAMSRHRRLCLHPQNNASPTPPSASFGCQTDNAGAVLPRRSERRLAPTQSRSSRFFKQKDERKFNSFAQTYNVLYPGIGGLAE